MYFMTQSRRARQLYKSERLLCLENINKRKSLFIRRQHDKPGLSCCLLHFISKKAGMLFVSNRISTELGSFELE